MFLNKIKDKYYYNLLNTFIEKGDVSEIRTLLKKKFINVFIGRFFKTINPN